MTPTKNPQDVDVTRKEAEDAAERARIEASAAIAYLEALMAWRRLKAREKDKGEKP